MTVAIEGSGDEHVDGDRLLSWHEDVGCEIGPIQHLRSVRRWWAAGLNGELALEASRVIVDAVAKELGAQH